MDSEPNAPTSPNIDPNFKLQVHFFYKKIINLTPLIKSIITCCLLSNTIDNIISTFNIKIIYYNDFYNNKFAILKCLIIILLIETLYNNKNQLNKYIKYLKILDIKRFDDTAGGRCSSHKFNDYLSINNKKIID